MTIIYAEEVGDQHQVPVLITDHAIYNLLIELRAYAPPGVDWRDSTASMYNILTLEQARKLCRNLTEWIRETEELQRACRRSEE